MLTTRALKFAHSEETQFQFPDLTCKKGEHWLLLGQSGTGKSTYLHLLGGLIEPQSGQIEIASQDLSALQGTNRDRFRGQNIGIIFQEPHLLGALNVSENILLAQKLAGLKPQVSAVEKLLKQLGLSHRLQANVHTLSLGEKQRVAIARALINQPALILADEPTSSLDDFHCNEVLELLEQQANEREATLVIVTHDQRLKNRFSNQITL